MPLTLGLSIVAAGAFGAVQVAPVTAASAHHLAVHTAIEAKAVSKKTNASAVALAVMASPPDPSVEKAVDSYFADIPVMIDIANCESKFHQYDFQGHILTSATDDLGVMQINVQSHKAEAKSMGFDLSNLQDNMAFARYLYKQQGTDPWLSSSKCWTSTAARDPNSLASRS